jgi:hypothetical protein
VNQFVSLDNEHPPLPRVFGLKKHCYDEDIFIEVFPSRALLDGDGPSIFKKEVTIPPLRSEQIFRFREFQGTPNLAHGSGGKMI